MTLSSKKANQLESTFIETINYRLNSINVGCLYKHPNIDISELSESLTTFSNLAISTHGCSNYSNLEIKAECRVRINYSELHREKLYEKNLLVLMSHKGRQWLSLRDRIF